MTAPSGPVLRDVEPGLRRLRSWGLTPVTGAHLGDVTGHLAGPDAGRAADLDAAFRDPSIRAVWAVRGGFGSTRIRSRLDWAALRQDPILLLGFSDITGLHHAAWRRLTLVTVHAPHVARLDALPPVPSAHLRRTIMESTAPGVLPGTGRSLVPGVAEGRLLGGNLALICAGLGTPDALDPAGAVLLLEDVGEAPYRVDRSLTQLREAGLLQRVDGVAVGTFVDCDPPDSRPSASVEEVLEDHLVDLGVPVVVDLPLGHGDGQVAVAHGGAVRLDAGAGTLAMTEAAVSAE